MRTRHRCGSITHSAPIRNKLSYINISANSVEESLLPLRDKGLPLIVRTPAQQQEINLLITLNISPILLFLLFTIFSHIHYLITLYNA